MKSTFLTFLCFTIVTTAMASDPVIWQQELSCDSNSKCRPRAMLVDSNNNELIVLGMSKSADTQEADSWSWKIDPNGTVKNKKSLGPLSKNDIFTVRAFGMKAIIKPDTGDIVRLKLDDANTISLSVTNRNMQSSAVKLNAPARNLPGTLILHDVMSCQNDSLLIVGQDRGKDGIVIRTNLAGSLVWEKIFDQGQTEILTGVTGDPDDNNFYVVGLSASTVGKIEFADAATVCVLRYDANGELKASSFFEGGLSPWPSSFPKVICLPSGIVLVVYDKSKNGIATELYAKAYTKELTPLWEKQILQTKEDGPPVHFDICATSEDRFVLVGQVNYWDFRFYEFDAGGTILQTLQLDREIGAGGIYADYLDGKIFVAYATKTHDNAENVKIKLLALKPHKTN